MSGWFSHWESISRPTASFLGLLPETLLKCLLFFEGQELLGFTIWMTFRTIVLCEDTVSLCIEDDEALDAVEREVHYGLQPGQVISSGAIKCRGTCLIPSLPPPHPSSPWLCRASNSSSSSQRKIRSASSNISLKSSQTTSGELGTTNSVLSSSVGLVRTRRVPPLSPLAQRHLSHANRTI